VLDRALATRGHFPSVDVLESISRVATKVIDADQRHRATTLRSVMAARRSVRDLIDVGAYQAGADPLVDAALANAEAIDAFLRQGVGEPAPADESWRRLADLAQRLGA
jgi:flagellum-specific ATP synthase